MGNLGELDICPAFEGGLGAVAAARGGIGGGDLGGEGLGVEA